MVEKPGHASLARRQTLALRLESAIDNSGAKFAFLAFELEFFAARGAKEISERAVVREGSDLGVAAMRAKGPSADPSFRPRARICEPLE
jgi:hypothetical protein